jgi:hypothetical protein
MPNPPDRHNRSDMPLDQAMGYATHLRITCSPPSIGPACRHSTVMLTSELHRLLPRCRIYREFAERLYCSRCKRRGWVSIEPVGR